MTGAGVGVLGGLLGLGGAEFRLPLLVTLFHYPLRRAVSLNLAISFVAVVVAAIVRWAVAGQAPLAGTGIVAICMMVGGMIGAAVGSRWLTRISDGRLHTAVRTLLVSIGLLLIAESVLTWVSTGLLVGPETRGAVAIMCGICIGAVATVLGVAGGELIIPTLIFLFGIPITAAGTTSLLISVPTMLVGLTRYSTNGQLRGIGEFRRVVVPMALGTVLGSAAGGFLVAYLPGQGLKAFLGLVLIGSALRVFKPRGAS